MSKSPPRPPSYPPAFYAVLVVLGIGGMLVIFGGVWLFTRDPNPAPKNEAIMVQENRTFVPLPASVPITILPTQQPLPPSWTPRASLTGLPSATPTATDTGLPSLTPLPTKTHTPFPTITPTPTITLTPTATQTPIFTPTATVTVAYNAPIRAAELSTNGYDIFNVLLIGSDRRPGHTDFRTDVLVIASINRTVSTVNLLSLPRDLYVYIPNVGYDRINTAAYWGTIRNYPGGGINLLRDTIKYNLGIPVHAYAMVDFNGFSAIVDAVNGVDMIVDCPLGDYRLKNSDLNPNIVGNWQYVQLDVGVHRMDGETALWYARSRATTSDFDRNRRHQMLLRAIWQRFKTGNLWDNIPELWESFEDTIQTDMPLNQIIALIPLGLQIEPQLIESHFLGPRELVDYTTDGGAQVLRMRPNGVLDVLQNFYTPPTQNQLYTDQPRLAIQNKSSIAGLDRVAIERLAWDGLTVTEIRTTDGETIPNTIIYDYTGNSKGSIVPVLRNVLGVSQSNVIVEPDPNRTVDYMVVLGESYVSNACTYQPYGNANRVN